MNKRLLTLLLGLCMLLMQTFPVYAKAEETNNQEEKEQEQIEWETIYISSAEELFDFAHNCRLDTWSQNKKVHLTCDIDLSGEQFVSIPTFGGYFNGQGHVIEGIALTDSLSYVGFFDTLQVTGVVSNLHIKAAMTPGGKQSVVGGIVGDNSGVIQNCTFDGSISANDYTGGITGFNESTGYISGCTSMGTITGLHFTGGIAGENLGSIVQCTNKAKINTSNVDRDMSLEDINNIQYSAQILDLNGSKDKKDMTDALTSTVDAGGIVGFSSGIVQGCINRGAVGYEHVGYNIGGIAGRQSGFLHNCTNKGEVLGRKDIGGIVGQAEPYITIDLTKDIAYQLSENINKLHDLIDQTLRDAGTGSDTLSSRLTLIQSFTDKALVDTGYLADKTVQFTDGVIGAVNDAAGRVDYVMDESEKDDGVLDQTNSAASNVKQSAEELDKAVAALDVYQYLTPEETVRYDADRAAIESANTDYNGYYTDAINAGKTQEEAIAEANAAYTAAHGTTYADDVKKNVEDMSSIAMAHSAEMTEAAQKNAQNAINYAQGAAANLESATSQTKGIVSNLNGRTDITLPVLGDAYRMHANSLVTNLQGMSDNMGYLNSEMNTSGDELLADMEAVNDQFNIIMLLFTDAVDGALDMDYTTMYEDNSKEAANDSKEGTIADCSNTAKVRGDLDVGGIAGTMAIEYDFDLESDVTGIEDSKANSTYETKCVLRHNVNKGETISQKSCNGGITGMQEMGMVLLCENYGRVSSENGDYAGGIAGQSLSAVKDCYAKCSLTGNKYVAGITGSGSDIEGCCSMVRISADSFFGAIAGETDEEGMIQDNYFVSEELAGIDRISFGGRAEPLSYEELLKRPNLPRAFFELTVDFLVDGKSVKQMTCHYQDSVTKAEYPEVTSQNGYYMKWDKDGIQNIIFDEEINAESVRYLTSLAGEEMRSNHQSVFLVDGNFHTDDQLKITHQDIDRTELRNVIESYQLTIPEDGENEHLVRYQGPDGENDHLAVYLWNGQRYQKISTETMGKYLTFPVLDKQVKIVITDTSKAWYDYWWAAVIAAALIVGGFVIMKKKKKR